MKRISLVAACSLAVLSSLALTGAGYAADKPAPAKADPAEPTAADFRTVDPENVLVIDTTEGRIMVEMAPDLAPKTVARIKELTREKFYDGLIFHRVIKDFMAQGGDPKGDGTGGSTKPDVPAEFVFRRGPDSPFVRVLAVGGLEDGFIGSVPIRSQNTGLMIMTADGKVQAWGLWCPGVAGFARANAPDSGNSQFFLMSAFNDGLEHTYTPWGHVLIGQNVVRVLKTGEPPPMPDKMTTVRILADLPAATRPKVQILDIHSPAFAAMAAHVASVCDIDLPVKVN